MQHLDEGVVHGWLDGELSQDEASRVEAHVTTCASCSAMVAEARGLVAASSRIVSALDVMPGGVLPAFGARKSPRRWSTATTVGSAIAATLVIAAGTLMSVRGPVDQAAPIPAAAKPAQLADLRRAKPASAPMAFRAERAAAPAAPVSVIAAAGNPSAPVQAAARAVPADSVGIVAAGAAVQIGVQIGKTAAVASGGTGDARAAGAGAASARSRAAAERAFAPVTEPATTSIYVGCYELSESVDVLPRRFALLADSGRAEADRSYEVRYVDSTGAVDGRIPDVEWKDAGGRAAIRTAGRGEILTLVRVGSAVTVRSVLGARLLRVTPCR